MGFNLQSSLDKELSYAYKIAKCPISFEIAGKIQSYPQPKSIKISPNFFRSYTCTLETSATCGLKGEGSKCCYQFWNIWTDDEYKKLVEIYGSKEDLSAIKPSTCKVNGKVFPIWLEDHSWDAAKCPHDRKGCQIHKMNPTHCAVPLIKFKTHGDESVYITKEQFSRNWRFGCPIPVAPLKRHEFEGWDLKVMNRVKGVSEYFQIPTYIDEVITKLKDNFERYEKGEQIVQIDVMETYPLEKFLG